MFFFGFIDWVSRRGSVCSARVGGGFLGILSPGFCPSLIFGAISGGSSAGVVG